jgi:outer membrane receptor protein involved in Fe transport
MGARYSTGVRRGAALPVLLLASTMLVGVTPAFAADQQAAEVDEVIITAQKREENLQDVPVSVQAINTTKLEQLQVQNFNDYAKFLPSVSFQTFGPGFTGIYMRGVASGGDGNHSGSLPSVGVYLDEQPITTIQGPLDIHVYDIARVEALAGPQGTLYGASSQAGTIRIITNKPDPTDFYGGMHVEANQVDHGGPGYVVEGFVNAPISEKAAVRLVGWSSHDGGYIDNVAGSRTFPTAGVTVNNNAIAEDDYNDVDTYGARAALRIELDDSWTVTPTIMGQSQRSNGIFAFDPNVGDLKVTHFFPEWARDRWYQAALTLEGKIGSFDLVYAGAYMKRNVDSQLDYSDYSYFYDTLYGYYLTDNGGNRIDPSQYIQAKDRYTKATHELRLSSDPSRPLRGLVGLFYSSQTHGIEQRYRVNNLADSLEVTGWDDTLWLTSQERRDVDTAVFGELAWDATGRLTLTGGLRLFKAENSLKGFFGFGTGYSGTTGEAACFAPTTVGNGPCMNLDKSVEETGFTHRLNATFKIDDDRMVYATWSTGFRPGGINRRSTLPPYKSDFLTSYEAGWKTTWLSNRLRFNGAVYLERWEDFQFSLLGQNGLTEIKNAGQAEIKGLEFDVNWRVDDHLILTAAAAFTDAAITENFCGYVKPATNIPETHCPNGYNPAPPKAPSGTELPLTPKVKANASARYEWAWGDWDAHVQGALVFQSSAWTDLRLVERAIIGKQPSYATFDLTGGIESGAWSIDAFLLNAFDERGNLYRYAECAEAVCGAQTYVVPTRPRTFGVKIGRKF